MKQLFALIIIMTFLSSCSESFQELDPKTFNEEITGRTDIKTPEDLVRVYYDYPEGEGSQPTITVENLQDNTFEITCILEGLEDDSQSGEKTILRAKLNGQTWSLLQIKRNWKCWTGRGHTSWGTETCN